jgi:hypothetical protein
VIERIKRDLAVVQAAYGEIDVDPDLRWFVIRAWALAAGWNRQTTRLLVLLAGYPLTAPDNFYTGPDLLLANGADPGSATNIVDLAGQRWRQFSYHMEAGDWQPEKGHNVQTFLLGVARRLREAS